MEKIYYIDGDKKFNNAAECAEWFKLNCAEEFQEQFEEDMNSKYGHIDIYGKSFLASTIYKELVTLNELEDTFSDYVNDRCDGLASDLENMSDVESFNMFGHRLTCDLIETGNEFTNDWEKMYDFFVLSKEKFLETYSYLTEDDYNATMKIVDNSGTSFAARKCTPISNIIDAIVSHSQK